jgi:predicted transcriptional regulator
MKSLIINIGGNVKADLKKAFENPKESIMPNSHTLYLKDTNQLYEILSPQRMELLMYITTHSREDNTVSELAKKLKRKQEAISRDTILLSKYNLIKKVKDKQRVYIKALYNSLDLKLTCANC